MFDTLNKLAKATTHRNLVDLELLNTEYDGNDWMNAAGNWVECGVLRYVHCIELCVPEDVLEGMQATE